MFQQVILIISLAYTDIIPSVQSYYQGSEHNHNYVIMAYKYLNYRIIFCT